MCITVKTFYILLTFEHCIMHISEQEYSADHRGPLSPEHPLSDPRLVTTGAGHWRHQMMGITQSQCQLVVRAEHAESGAGVRLVRLRLRAAQVSALGRSSDI